MQLSKINICVIVIVFIIHMFGICMQLTSIKETTLIIQGCVSK